MIKLLNPYFFIIFLYNFYLQMAIFLYKKWQDYFLIKQIKQLSKMTSIKQNENLVYFLIKKGVFR